MDNDIVVEFEVDNAKLISVNEQYIHPVRRTKNGRYMSFFAPSNELKKLKDFYDEILLEKITDEDIEKLNNTLTERNSGLELSIILGIPDNEILSTDASNYIKALEDSIVRRTKIDDSKDIKVSVEKRIYDTDDNRYAIKIRITPFNMIKY